MPTVVTSLPNLDFEQGDVGWDKGGHWVIQNAGTSQSGLWNGHLSDSTGAGDFLLINTSVVKVTPGQSITAQGSIKGSGSTPNGAALFIQWLDGSFAQVGLNQGNSTSNADGQWELSTITASAPGSAVYATLGFSGNVGGGGGDNSADVDSASWNYVSNRAASLVTPTNGQVFTVGDSILMQVSITGTSPAVTQVVYNDGATPLAVTTASPYSYNITSLAAGSHTITAAVTLSDGTVITTNSATITVNAVVVPPTTREFKASNAYTYLDAGNFSGLASSIPAIAKITAVSITVDYTIEALIRSKDLNIADPAGSNPNVAFDIINGADIEATLLSPTGATLTPAGAPLLAHIPVIRSNFTLTEQGTSENKKWTVLTSTPATATLGSNTQFFGLPPMVASDFLNQNIGFRFLPTLLPKPAYADSGDVCFRFFINKIRVQVYFNAGSADYYFASPDKTQILKGQLVSSYDLTGSYLTGDASGVLQLKPTLTIMLGTTTHINDNWTIHAAYPPTNANQVGLVDVRTPADGIGMSYNGLPSYQAVINNRSRYGFISTNFYAVTGLDSIYGVHGLPRAFVYNGDFFYKVYTQATAAKDCPRHVANHQGHLALGYQEGRVDISVAGQPYNFDGVKGASEWAIGDNITGLLQLSGTLLGVFASKSIWGISGTTVDNFAQQVITPRTGAIEYTVVDMGYPIYANTYGIYTLSQTEQYGDYLGDPLSQDISPWIRPRLLKSVKSANEVVVAWPARGKNQYRLAFSDGYVLSMTIAIKAALHVNFGIRGIDTVTFSKQKYFLTTPNTDPHLATPLYNYPTLIPVAISSQLSDTGEERIHTANFTTQYQGTV